MKKLSTFLTLITYLTLQGQAYAVDACYENKVGEYKKALWSNSVSDGLKGELVNQLARKDDLFEKVAPEIEFSLNDYLDFKLNFNRSVDNHLPLPFNGEISDTDFFKYKVNNHLHLEITASTFGPFLFAEGNAGVDLIHSSNVIPGKERSSCEIFSKIIDQSTNEGEDFFNAACDSRDKSKFTQYYEKTIDFFSMGVSKVLNVFADSDKNIEHAKDPLAPMKVHSMLGIPMDHTVFFENNNDIAIGDIIEHTSFYSIKPLGIKFDLFSFITPTHSRFRRYFRSLGFEKVYGNKVIVEVQDTVLSGDSTEVFKIRPKIGGILKLNFGKWSLNDFREQNLSQKFEIDLNKDLGVRFFRKILKKAYSHSGEMKQNSIIIDHLEYQDAVTAYSPVYQTGNSEDDRITLKFPGTFKYENRSYVNVSTLHVDDKEYTKGEILHREYFKNKIAFNLGIFEVRKKDRRYECQMKVDSNETDMSDKKKAMNIECNYFNKYATNEIKENVRESIQMVINSSMTARDEKILDELDLSKRDELTMYTNLSFSANELNSIVSATEDQAYGEVAKLLFGESAENIFAKKYHGIWKNMRFQSLSSSTLRKSQIYKKCSLFLAQAKILSHVEDQYDEFNGVVGRGKGIEYYTSSRCYNYFRMAKRVVGNLLSIKRNISSEEDIQKMVDTFKNLEYAGIVQNVLVRLSGGVGFKGTHYTYIVTSPALESNIIQTNGRKYSAELPVKENSILEATKSVFYPRIKSLEYKVNSCLNNKINVYLELFYPVEKDSDLLIKLNIKKFSIAKDESFFEHYISLNEMELENGIYRIAVELPEDYLYDVSYTAYAKIVNGDDLQISKETKSYLKKLDNIEDEFEKEAEH
jgi:hypothetical protein